MGGGVEVMLDAFHGDATVCAMVLFVKLPLLSLSLSGAMKEVEVEDGGSDGGSYGPWVLLKSWPSSATRTVWWGREERTGWSSGRGEGKTGEARWCGMGICVRGAGVT